MGNEPREIQTTVVMKPELRRQMTETFIVEVDQLDTQFDIFHLLKRVCSVFGFKAFMVMALPEPGSSRLAANTRIANWPTGMMAGYDALGLLKSSPVVAAMRTSTKPLVTSLEARTDASPVDEREASRALFEEYGFRMGLTLPVHDASGERALISFHGDRQPPSYGELLELNMLCIHIYERLSTVADEGSANTSPLTDREKECLSWTAEGKTSRETADILGLSEHTVNHYLNRSARKLDTVNRTQAVARALRRGFIH